MLVAVLVLAAALRFWELDRLPPGLYRDEAIEGLDGLRILGGERPVFWESYDLGREVLFTYLVAPAVGTLGRTPAAIRTVSALLGTLTVGAIFFLGRLWFNPRIGLLAAAITASTVWPINLSRVGMRMVTLPLLYILAAAFLWLALRTGKLRYWIAVGALYGLSFYAYAAARFGLILALAFGFVLLVSRARSLRVAEPLTLSAVMLLVVAPLAFFAVDHPDSFWLQPAQKSILNPEIHGGDPIGFLARNVLSTSLMFISTGDFNARHNVPWRPVFDPLLAILFLLGVGISARRARASWTHLLMLVWLGIMLLPTVLAEDAPHFSRAAGAMPAAMLLAAIGMDGAMGWIRSRSRGRAWPAAVAAAPLLLTTALTVNDYFVQHMRDPNTYFHFDAGAVELAQTINDYLGTGWTGTQRGASAGLPSPDRQVYLARRLWDGWVALRFLVPPSAGWEVVDPAVPLEAVPTSAKIVAWPYEDYRALLGNFPPGTQVEVRPGSWERGDLDPEPRLVYVSYTISPYTSKPDRVQASFGGTISLLDYALVQEADQLRVVLWWQAESQPERELNVFVHLIEDGQLVGQADGPPAYGFYPTHRWKPGIVVRDEHRLAWEGGLDPQRHRILLGLYRLDTLERLEAFDAHGELRGDSLTLSW